MKIITILIVVIMMVMGYTLMVSHDTPSDEILECQMNISIPTQNLTEPGLPWGYECMDCHQNPHDPMAGVPSDKEFAGHKDLDCVLCHSDYDNPQLCISCHKGHSVLMGVV